MNRLPDKGVSILMEALQCSDADLRDFALRLASTFGSEAKTVLPFLKRLLEDDRPYIRLTAAAAICSIDPDHIDVAMPVIIDALEFGIPLDQSHAAQILGDLGEAGVPTLESLEKLLEEGCAGVRCSAGIAIWRITGDLSAAVSVGVDLLDSADWLDRYVGAEHLGVLGPMAESALWDLRTCALTDEDAAVRWVAQAATEKIVER